MAWDGSTRSARLPADWQARRRAVFTRAGGRCQALDLNGVRCPRPATDCDHIDRGDNHDLANLQALCSPCHKAKTQREARASRPSRLRPRERHPGLL